MSSLSSSMLLSAAIRSQDDGKGIIISSNVERSIKEADILLKNGNLDDGLKDLNGREEGVKWIVLHVFHSDYEVREQVIKILGRTKLDYELQGILWNEFKGNLSGSSASFVLRLIEGLQLKDGAQSLRILSLFIEILGLHLRNSQGLAVINALLAVIEKGFRGTESQRIASFHAWKVLIDNFSLAPSILSSSKRTRLIVRPLASLINAKTEDALKVKMEVWWYFIQKLGNDISSHIETVFVPFIGFLFGVKKEGHLNSKPVDSPIKKFANIDIMSLDAFYRLIVLSSKNEDCTLPPCHSIQKPGLLNKKNLTEHYKTFFLALEKSSELIKFGNNRSLVKFKLIFDAISDVLHILITDNGELEKIKEIAYNFCRCVQVIIFENKRKPHTNKLLFAILEKTVSIMPHRFIFYKNNNSISILQIFLDIVFHTDFLQQAKESKSSYMDIFSLILDKGSVKTFILVQKVTQKAFDASEEKKTKDLIEIWQNIWRTVVARMKYHVEQTREINEANDNISYKLNTVKSILLFPIQHLMGITSKEFWKSWGEFYSICIQSAEVILSYETLELESFICLRANELLKKDCEQFSSHQVFIFNNYCRITTFITSNMSLSEKCSFNSIRPNIDFMSELVALASKSLLKVGGASVGVSYLCTSLINLLSVLPSGLIKPVVESTSIMITTMLGSSFMSAFGSGFETHVEHLVDKIVNLIQARYTGEYYEDFLNTIKTLVLCLLTHPKKPIKSSGHRLWQLTFAHTLDENKIPSDILSVLRKNLILSSESSMSISSLDSFIAPNLHTDILTKTHLKESPTKITTFNDSQLSKESGGNKSPANLNTSPANLNKSPFSALKRKRNNSLNINEEDTQDFVPIISQTNPKKLILTEHQKEVLETRKDDIPALYSELSRDDSSQSQILSSLTEKGIVGSAEENRDELNPDENSSTSQSLLQNKNEEVCEKPLAKRRSSRVSKAAKEDGKTGTPPSKILKENLKETISSNSSSNDSTETKECATQEDVVESSQSKPTTIISSTKSRKRKGTSTVTNPERKRARIETDKSIGKENKKLRAKKLNKFGESPLQIAIKKGDLSKVTELLKSNAEINHRCYANWTPLHDSIKDGDNTIAIIKILLEYGADINATGGEDANTPLHESVLYCSPEVIKFLIHKGADTNTLNKHALKPIDLASDEVFNILRPVTDLGISKMKQKASSSNPEPEKLTTRRTKRCIKSKKTKLEHNQNSIQKNPSQDNDELKKNEESQSELTKDNRELNDSSGKSASCVESEIKVKIEAIDSISTDEEKIIENEVAINMCWDTLQENEGSYVETINATSKDSVNPENKIEDECTEIPESMETNSSEDLTSEHDVQIGKLISLPKPIIESGEVIDSTKSNTDSAKTSVSIITKAPESPLRSLHKSRAAKLIEMSKAALVKKSDSAPTIKISSPIVSTPSSKPWQKFAPSPNASPTASILKRRYSDFSPSNRSRKVQFLDPPVSERVEIPRKNRFYNKSNSESEVSYNYLPSPPVEDAIVYSPLSACQEPISCILRDLTNKTWLKTAEKDLKEKNISTIGDLSKLKKSEASQLKGLKPPILVTLRDTLKTFEKSYKWPKKTDNLEEKEDSRKFNKVSEALAPFVEVQTPEEEEKNIQEIYERPSPSPTEDAEACTKGVQVSLIASVSSADKSTQPDIEIQSPASIIRESSSQTPSKDYESQGTQSSSTVSRIDKSLGTDTISLESKINELLSLDKSKRWEIANKILASLQND
nr:telomere-associated protein RIF1-like [Lepeophtheirus salmonis]